MVQKGDAWPYDQLNKEEEENWDPIPVPFISLLKITP